MSSPIKTSHGIAILTACLLVAVALIAWSSGEIARSPALSVLVNPHTQLANVSDFDNELVGHWTFDEGSGTTANDSSNNGNTGALTSSSMWTTQAAVGSGALQFDGQSDDVSVQNSNLNHLSSATWSAWIYTPTTGGTIIDKDDNDENDGWMLYTDSTRAIWIRFPTSYCNANDFYAHTAASAFTSNSWNLITVTWTGDISSHTAFNFYVNGVSVSNDGGTDCPGGVHNDTSLNAYIGYGRNASTGYFNGSIDDVRIYNQALSTSQIQQLYALGAGGTPLPTDTQAPTVPTGVSAVANSSTQINVSWNSSSDNVGVAGYKVYRNGSQITTTSGLSYLDTNLSPNTTYSYTVSAYDAANNTSNQSAQAQATTPSGSIPSSSKIRYIVPGLTTGAHTGLDWTNAYSDVPLTQYSRLDFTKVPLGTTVYVAGSATKISSIWIDSTNAQSESDRITFKKATQTDHGTDTGWQTSYGALQAVITSVSMTAYRTDNDSYITIDGVYRSDPRSGYGFKIEGSFNNGNNIYGSNAGTSAGPNINHLVFRYIEMNGANGYVTDGCMDAKTCDSGASFNGSDDVLFEYNYVHDDSGQIGWTGASNITVRDNVFVRNDSTPIEHSNAVSVPGTAHNIFIYNNWFEDIEGTGWISFLGGGNYDNIQVYNNVFYDTPANPANRTGTGHGAFTTAGFLNDLSNFGFYNNDIINFVDGSSPPPARIFIRGGCGSNCRIENNLWYCPNGTCGSAGVAYPENTVLHFTPSFSTNVPGSNDVGSSIACTHGSGTLACTGTGCDTIDVRYNSPTDGYGALAITNITGSFQPGDLCTDKTGSDWKIDTVNIPANITISNNYYSGNFTLNNNLGTNAIQPQTDERPFTNYSIANFHLANNGNSALTGGIPVTGSFNFDMDNNSRPSSSSWSIGAYQYCTSNCAPVTPTTVSGLCSTTLNQCVSGTFSDVADTSSNYLWSCTGSNGGTTASCSLPITTTSDTTPPTLSSISTSNITTSGAAISWITNEVADTQVQYGLTTAYGSNTALDPTLVTSHTVTLSNLAANTQYHYRVISKDGTGNTSTSADYILTTSASTPNTPAPTGGGTSAPAVPSNTGTPASSVSVSSHNISQAATSTPAIPTALLSIPFGSRGTTVIALQNYLIQYGYLSAGLNTGYYGTLTQAAVARYRSAASEQPSASPSSTQYTFTRSLTLGSTGTDVKNLQIFLNTHGFTVSSTGNGSRGYETTYFGLATKAALVKFQEAHASAILTPLGLTHGTGNFGPSTMKVVNNLK